MAFYLEELTIRLATGVSQFPPDDRQALAQFLVAAQQPDGGFSGREGGSDLYYTSFALRGLAILGELQGDIADRCAAYLIDQLQGEVANVDFFSQFSCKIYIEDLYHTLSSFDYFSPEDGFTYQTVFDYLLPYTQNTRFDIILSWDIFNYLERDEFKSLISHLGNFCNKGTLLFSLISTLKHIPEKPTTFRIQDQESLQYQAGSTVLRPCPRYQQTDLNHLMPHFRVCNSFLLRNGFKEYLLVYE